MRPEEIKKLLGGYATGNLTPEEQRALFAAALENQELFDALAREQSLRDLLRDPAARGELLAALDTPATGTGGFWKWLRRPAVAVLATVCVVAIAVAALWRAAQMPVPDRMIVAEMRQNELRQAPAGSPPPSVAIRQAPANIQPKAKPTPREFVPPATAPADPGSAAPKAADKIANGPSAPAVAPAPQPPPPPASALLERDAVALAATELKKEVANSTTQTVEVTTGATLQSLPLDARAIFYLNQATPGANTFVAPSGGGGAGPPPARQMAAARSAADSSTPARLGIRVSILRGDQEVDLTTPLDRNETVRLKLIPNADGYLRVTEGARTVASGAAQTLKPFETPALSFEGSGQRQLVITLSRTPIGEPSSQDAVSRGNIVAPSADQGHATYVVSGPRQNPTQQVVIPVTLTYR